MYVSDCPVIALVVQLLASYHSDTVQLLSGYDTDIIQISSSSSCGPIFGQLWSNYSPEVWLYFLVIFQQLLPGYCPDFCPKTLF